MTEPTPTRRFLRPTPAWLIFGLLVVEGLLWLSERYSWFGFNHHKGWTVLTAVVAVGVAMLVMLLWFIASLLFRWRFQFSIRSLLLLALAVAVPCSWLAAETKQARAQRAAVYAIEILGGIAAYDYQLDASGVFLPNVCPSGPVWLRGMLGDDFVDSVVGVDLSRAQTEHAGWENIECATGQALFDNKLNDADLEHLSALKTVQSLNLDGTKVTDAGLEHLKALSQLQSLDVENTLVTDAGVKKLQQALPNCKIIR